MKSFVLRSSQLLLVLVGIAVVAASVQAQTIVVNNVEELYSTVNDPVNMGASIQLAPGVYMLSANDPAGVSRPNGGRLELQENMSLLGTVGDRSAAIIDAVNLPQSSLPSGTVPPGGAVRIGRGRNSIEWLTVRNARFGQGNIVTGLPYDGSPQIRIAHIASSGAPNQMSIGNFGPTTSGKTLEVDIVDNDFSSGSAGLRQGYRIGNFSGALGAVVNARVVDNRVWGNQFSLLSNNGASESTINAYSAGNRYFDNGAGLVLIGGTGAGNGNTINYEGRGDRFISNDEGAFLDRGGITFLGGSRSFLAPQGANDNTISAHLFGCRFSGNAFPDIYAVAARATPDTLSPVGVNNHVTVTLHGLGNVPFTEFVADSVPSDPFTTNSATILR